MNHKTFSEFDLTSLLSLSFSSLIYELNDRMSQLGFGDIRPAHGFMFEFINTNGATGTEIAEYLGITKQAVSKMVDYLEKVGYVMRKNHPTDKRGKIIVLTEKGLLVMKLKDEILVEIEQRCIESLGFERIKMIKEDLSKLVNETNKDNFSPKPRPIW